MSLDDENDSVDFSYLDATTARLTVNGDSYDYARSNLRDLLISGGGGNDQIELSPDVNIVANLSGDDGDDRLVGGLASDRLAGGLGNNTLIGGPWDDDLDGTADTLVESAGTTNVPQTFTLRASSLTGTFGNDLLVSIERASLTGGRGGDSISVDGLSPFPGSTTLVGGDGNDTILGGPNADVLFGGDGDDALTGLGGDDSLTGENGNDFLDGGAHVIGDTVVESSGTGNLMLSPTGLGGRGNDTFALNSIERAMLTGNQGPNVLDASQFGGPVTLVGGEGADNLQGGAGNDRLSGQLGYDSLDGGGERSRHPSADPDASRSSKWTLGQLG